MANIKTSTGYTTSVLFDTKSYNSNTTAPGKPRGEGGIYNRLYLRRKPTETTMRGITVGSDPEVFLRDHNGKYISAVGKIGGTKENPKKFYSGWVQEDNVAAEFNIKEASSGAQFDKSIQTIYSKLEQFVKSKYDCDLVLTPCATFEADELAHPHAQMMGCDPDYNAWTFFPNESPSAEVLGNVRTTSGHIHVGAEALKDDPAAKTMFARLLDIHLGLPALFIYNDPRVYQRRKYYGAAGAYRPKPYGLEYRVLDNFWIKSPTLRRWIFDQVGQAYEVFLNSPIQKLDEHTLLADERFMIRRMLNIGPDSTDELLRAIDYLSAASIKQLELVKDAYIEGK